MNEVQEQIEPAPLPAEPAPQAAEPTEPAADVPVGLWRVKKAPDNAIYGPVDAETLKEWANSAQIAPEDMIDESDEEWRLSPDVEFLEMYWQVKLPTGEIYGPTTVGTLREFINEALVSEKAMAEHAKTRQSLPLTALVAAADFEKKRALRRPGVGQNKSTALLAVDMAKDQHIRQLEEDLKELRREHEILVHRYRQLTLQMQENVKPKIVRAAPGGTQRVEI
jgi:ribosomal protein L19E